jgi:hypothetical protein
MICIKKVKSSVRHNPGKRVSKMFFFKEKVKDYSMENIADNSAERPANCPNYVRTSLRNTEIFGGIFL